MRKAMCTMAMGAALLCSTAAHAGDATQKCQLAKLKAQGKLQSCLKKQRGNVVLGKTDESANCQTKFAAALQRADDKAAAAETPTSCRYIDNLDGTVSDLNTGLMWEKKDDLGGIHDKDNLYTWASSGTTPNGTAFTGFLGTLNAGTTSNGTDVVTPCFAGYCDWRLPTIQELKEIRDRAAPGCQTGVSPCVDPAFGSMQSAFYWSSTSATRTFYAWGVTFHFGDGTNTGKTFSYSALAVRGGL